jgi:hypothetical protein
LIDRYTGSPRFGEGFFMGSPAVIVSAGEWGRTENNAQMIRFRQQLPTPLEIILLT